jgi:glutathione S-transferase
MTVELYYFQPLGTNSGRVFQALLEKGVDFVPREISGRDFEHLKPAYLKVNPKGQVPTLVHDGVSITEGAIANEYIDETFEGPPLRPADLRERWRMRVWSRWAENDLGRCLMMINWNRVVPTFVGERTEAEVLEVLESVPDPDRRRSWIAAWRQVTPPEVMEESHRRAREGARRVDAHLKQHPWVAGSVFSLADIDLNNFCGFMAMWMPELVNEKDTPAFVEWRAKMEERPSTKEMRARSNFSLSSRGGAAESQRPAGAAAKA